MLDLFELIDVILSWRLFVGIALTACVCLILAWVIPGRGIQLAVCIPLALVGVALSFVWQMRAE
jgi:hypothetical protein